MILSYHSALEQAVTRAAAGEDVTICREPVHNLPGWRWQFHLRSGLLAFAPQGWKIAGHVSAAELAEQEALSAGKRRNRDAS